MSQPDPRPPFTRFHIWAQYEPVGFFKGKINLHNLAPPPCNSCSRPSTLTTVHPGNPNNNGGRPYYKCSSCPWDNRWVTWADARGFSPHNTKCDCGFGSRLDYAGAGHGVENQGRKFWVCATGTCEFFSWGEQEQEDMDADGEDDNVKAMVGAGGAGGIGVKREGDVNSFARWNLE